MLSFGNCTFDQSCDLAEIEKISVKLCGYNVFFECMINKHYDVNSWHDHETMHDLFKENLARTREEFSSVRKEINMIKEEFSSGKFNSLNNGFYENYDRKSFQKVVEEFEENYRTLHNDVFEIKSGLKDFETGEYDFLIMLDSETGDLINKLIEHIKNPIIDGKDL